MDKIYFTVNGEHFTLSGSEVSPMTSLNDYLRNYLQLHGTKAMCREGGCGACIVSVTQTHPATKEKHTFAVNSLHGTKAMSREGGCGACIVSVTQTHPATNEKHTFAVNSCLVHVLSCHQWDITTVEGLGNRKDGYHAVQRRLAAFNGTQCGYCTPGWVMGMYSLYENSKTKLSMQEVEKSFGGNLCRCTGYRPILDAFKSFANDADPELKSKLQDVEDLHQIKCLQKCERRCSVVDEEWCVIQNKQDSFLEVGGLTSRWYKAYTVEDVFKVLNREGLDNYKLVAGNTGLAVFNTFWCTPPQVFIDISSIETLKDTLVDVNLVIGAGTCITDFMKICKTRQRDSDFKYLEGFYEHLDLLAHVPVRNIGTIGGNLAMKNARHEFSSDIFLLLETIGAMVTIVSHDLSSTELSMQEFLKVDLKDKLITNIKLPPLSDRCLTRSYKIMPRAQNALALVNAGFFFKLDSNEKIQEARIVYGTISPSFVRATETEKALQGDSLLTDGALKKALMKLDEELVPTNSPPEASPLCKKTIALGLFYRAVLSLAPQTSLNPRFVSGASPLSRGVSKGTQTFDTDKTLWPLNKPIPKIEALTQCSGEVKYACDVPASRREVHVAFVLSTICLGEIERFDASEALKTPGVVAFFTAKDIPGKNTFVPTNVSWMDFEEELLASKTISYYGQPVALIAATTYSLALAAADLVKVFYKKSDAKPVLIDHTLKLTISYYGQPVALVAATTYSLALAAADSVKVFYKKSDAKLVLTIKEALNAPDKDRRLRQDADVKAKNRGTDTTHVIKGNYTIPSQYHFTMETQSCRVSHTDDGLLVRSATQWMDLVHVAVASLLGIDQNKVVVSTGRVGGGYGGKASRSSLAACACALAAHLLNRDATMVVPLTHNMAAVGKRQECYMQYELGVNNDGLIQYLDLTYYSDCGYNFNDTSGANIAAVLANLYASDSWNVRGYSVITDKAGNTWCRAPGTTEAIATLEHIMEQIAHVTKKDPIDVRITNLAPAHTSIKDLIDSFKMDTNYNDRKVQIAKYNSDNAWKKKGLKLAIMSFPIEYDGNIPVTISVYHGDGTISISHGGIEMGQGINTKLAQVCAYTLKVPMEKISVLGSDSFVSPNAIASSGSVTSECAAYATIKACTDLLAKLEPVRTAPNEPWEEVVKKAHEKGVNLQSSYMMSQKTDALKRYDVYGVCIAEVELDVLTGRHEISRVDFLEDAGVSLSPDIDVGQIEGAFVMGVGMWTSEQLVYCSSGKLLTDATWRYHPLGARDGPIEGAFIMGVGMWTSEQLVYCSSGKLLTDATWRYHPLGARDGPADLRVTLRRNAPNAAGVLRSKATGEPSLALSVTVCHALRDAILEARKEFGYHDEQWLDVDTPYTVENILKAISPKIESFKLH